ncbi:MAG TPA: hypothetical protein VFM53_05060 [Anaeromyxobacteraceae bacterium]|nr:hypothetical protein [Anaeromyxobacteraceae bacterium]
MQDRARTALVAAAVGLATCAAFLPTLRAGLVWDDTSYVLSQGDRHLAGALTGDLIAGSSPAHGPVGYWRPLPVATFWVAERVSPGPAAHHAASVLLHGLAAALLFLLLRGRLGTGPGAAGAAVAGALAWALHPASVEAVAWVSGRYDLLAGLFAIAVLALPWRPGPGRGAAYGLLFLGGLLSKEGFLALAPVVWVDDRAAGRSWREAAPRWVGVAAAVAVWANLRFLLGIAAVQPAPIANLPGHYLSAVTEYLVRAAAPLPLTVSHRFAAGGGAALAAGAVAVVGLVVLGWRRRTLATPVALFLAGIFPAAMAAGRLGQAPDRYLFLPSIGLAWLLAAALAGVAARSRVAGRVALAAVALLVAAEGVATVRRLPDWVSDDALFAAALRVDPQDPQGNLHFGLQAARAGRVDEARRLLERGRQGDPGSARIAAALAWLHLRRGDATAALWESRRAVELAPGSPEARLYLANALHLAGDHAGELVESTRAVALSPRYREARIVRALARCEVERDRACEIDLDALEREGFLSGADAQAARVEVALGRRDLALAEERLARLRASWPDDRRIPQLARALGGMARPPAAAQ